MKKLVYFILINISFIVVSFFFGYSYSRKELVVYQKGKYIEVFPSNWPTYNLPLTEYSYMLRSLNDGDISKVKERLNSFLDKAIEDANYRLHYSNEKQQLVIKRALAKAEHNRRVKGPVKTIRSHEAQLSY